MRNIMIVWNKCESRSPCFFESKQECARLGDRESVRRSLSKHPDEAQFRDRTSCERRKRVRSQPGRDAVMEFVIHESKRHQSVYIEQISHGTFVNISSTSLLLNAGAPEPAVRTGSPVAGSVTILTW